MSNIIIYLPNEPLGKQGGMERATHQLACLLRDSGHNVSLLCQQKNRLGEPYAPPVPLIFIPEKLNKTGKREFINDLIRQSQTELIIDQTEGGIIGRYGFFKKRKQIKSDKVKLAAIQHNSQYTYLKYYNIIKKKPFDDSVSGRLKNFAYHDIYLKIKRLRACLLQKKLFRDLVLNYDQIITLSQGGIAEFKKIYSKAPSCKLTAIPNIIPDLTPSAQPCRKERRCLFVGRLDNAAKGVDRLLRIWKILEKDLPEWHLNIVGNGQDADMLKEMAHKLNLKNISFEGFQDPVPYYERSSFLCLTSTFEGFGLVLAEAMQHGCVPLAFDSYPAVRDIILPGKTGELIQPFNEQEYAHKLASLASNPNNLAILAENARRHIQEFSPGKISIQWNDLIQHLLYQKTVIPNPRPHDLSPYDKEHENQL